MLVFFLGGGGGGEEGVLVLGLVLVCFGVGFFVDAFHDPMNYWKYAHNFFILDQEKHRYFSLVTYRMSQECISLQVCIFRFPAEAEVLQIYKKRECVVWNSACLTARRNYQKSHRKTNSCKIFFSLHF